MLMLMLMLLIIPVIPVTVTADPTGDSKFLKCLTDQFTSLCAGDCIMLTLQLALLDTFLDIWTIAEAGAQTGHLQRCRLVHWPVG